MNVAKGRPSRTMQRLLVVAVGWRTDLFLASCEWSVGFDVLLVMLEMKVAMRAGLERARSESS